eukprot:2647065-Rhodomonas_salina.2
MSLLLSNGPSACKIRGGRDSRRESTRLEETLPSADGGVLDQPPYRYAARSWWQAKALCLQGRPESTAQGLSFSFVVGGAGPFAQGFSVRQLPRNPRTET